MQKKFPLIIKKQENSINFEQALLHQQYLVEQIIQEKIPETIWFLEHPHVYTLGTGIKKDEKIFSDNQENINIPIIQTNRGGKITYHGPGQAIIYFLLNLKNVFYPHQPDLIKFIYFLEELILISLQELGIKNANRNSINHGIWIGNNKISAIGIRLTKWTSYHGISLNINPDLKFYDQIVPCGLENYGVTSIFNENFILDKSYIYQTIIDNILNIFPNYYFV